MTTASIVPAEPRFGVVRLSYAERRRKLKDAVDRILADLFDRPRLPFDDEAVAHSETFMQRRRDMGRPVEVSDGLIAATAMRHGRAVATRNGKDFEGCGQLLVNPWDA